MRVLITGSRRWSDRKPIIDRLYTLGVEHKDVTIVIGYDPARDKPQGVDRIAYQEAQKAGLRVEPHPAADHPSPLDRNTAMVRSGADLCIAFWDGRSSGTADTMRKASEAGIPVETIRKET